MAQDKVGSAGRWRCRFELLRRSKLALSVTAFLIAFVLPAAARAATIKVTTPKDETAVDGSISLREAVASIDAGANANSDVSHTGTYGVNDTIILPAKAAHYMVSKGELSLSKTLKLLGAGAAKTTIDGNLSNRILHVTSGSLTVSGLTFTRGKLIAAAVGSQGGGAIRMGGGALNVSHSAFRTNSTMVGPGATGISGGGAIWTVGPLTVRGTSFSGNSAFANGGNASGGGAIFVGNLSPVSLVSDHFSGDRFREINGSANLGGGGLAAEGGAIAVARTRFSGEQVRLAENSGNSGGGAIYDGGGGITVSKSSLNGNNLTINPGVNNDGGGALYDDGGASDAVKLTATTIAYNKVKLSPSPITSSGGGGVLSGGGQVTMVNSTLGNNSLTVSGHGDASDGGGGLLNFGPATFQNVTIARNSANVRGGGLFVGLVAPQTLKSTIIAANKASSGANCSGSSFVSGGHNLENANTCNLSGPGDEENTNPLLGPLQSNGGPTQTMALLAGSPAIDKIPITAGCPTTDQRGKPRPDKPEQRCDIGAYEHRDP